MYEIRVYWNESNEMKGYEIIEGDLREIIEEYKKDGWIIDEELSNEKEIIMYLNGFELIIKRR